MDEAVNFRDILRESGCVVLKPAEMSNEERQRFLYEVEQEVERICSGEDERLNGKDYRVVY